MRHQGSATRGEGGPAAEVRSGGQQGTASEVILYWEAQNEPTELINTFRLTELFFYRKIAVGSEFTGEIAELL